MKKVKVAISAEDDLFKSNRILNIDWAKKFPGASWLPMLKNHLEPEFDVVTADVALSHVCQGYWDAKDVVVIQHGHDNVASNLVEKGAFPLAVTCFESPLYLGKFYDHVEEIAPRFKHGILFSGLHQLYETKLSINHHTTFPSYFLEDLNGPVIPWGRRKFMVAVIGNKYVLPAYCLSFISPMEWYWGLKKKVAQLIYMSFSSSRFPVRQVQLQEMRLEIIAFFMEKGLLDLYGKGWGVLCNLPPKWQKTLQSIFTSNPPQACQNKLETIRPYRYGLCIENAKFPGYVTEKIIDCLVTGVIPLYMGAPDIEQYIPEKCFVDLRKFTNWDDLQTYLQEMSEKEAMAMINCGTAFLRSEKGRCYSYEGFAEFMEDIVRTECGSFS